MKKIFIAATKQNDGKTTVSLGLISNLSRNFKRIGFIKPIGQRYLEEEGLKIDEDSYLIEEVCGIKCGLKDMSPIAVEKGFTEKYISRPDKKSITKQIKAAYKRVSRRQDLVVIEGTGHAGVGSVFDHSNAYVAKLLGSKVIIISSGGIGRPIDEIMLNKAMFDREGVKVLGVIINKVLPNKVEKISSLVKKGLKRKDIKVLGVIPYNPVLSQLTVEQVFEETGYKVLCGKEHLESYVSKVIVGAMRPDDAVKYIADNSLLITPGDREDMIKTLIGPQAAQSGLKGKISGIVLSGGITPEKDAMQLLEGAGIPVLIAEEDTYAVSSSIHDLTVKIRPRDKTKIDSAVRIIKDYVDLASIVKGM